MIAIFIKWVEIRSMVTIGLLAISTILILFDSVCDYIGIGKHRPGRSVDWSDNIYKNSSRMIWSAYLNLFFNLLSTYLFR